MRALEDRLVILDEVSRMPDLFTVLRGLIDEGRRRGRRTGRFLILGSASPGLWRQSAESLAGRIIYSELAPIHALEVEAELHAQERLWLRGGFPESLLAADDAVSLEWREAFLRPYLERDIPELSGGIPAETLRRFLTMLAHEQGRVCSAGRFAAALGLSDQTVAGCLDLFVDLLLVRRLPPWVSRTGKRMSSLPRAYVRDSGILHALLGLGTRDALLDHPDVYRSWVGHALESLLAVVPSGCEPFSYRSSSLDALLDLLLQLPSGRLWAIKTWRNFTHKPGRALYRARKDLEPERTLVVHPGRERFPMGEGVEAIGLPELAAELRAQGG